MEKKKPKSSPKRFLNIFVLAMMNMAIMASLRNLPTVAEYGLGSLFLYVIVALLFLMPAALVSAELATGWAARTGGVYVWVREALGDRWGFFAIWMQWVHNVTWYPVILSFVATTIAYMFHPELAENKLFITIVVLVGFWSMTLFNFLGLSISSWVSTAGVILGTIIPGIFLVCLGFSWYFSGMPIETPISSSALIPKFSGIGDYVFLAGMFLAFSGLEVNAVHAREVKNPQANFPRAILIAASLTFFLFILGSLSIAIIIPQEKISLVSGIMQTFFFFLEKYNLHYLIQIVGILIIIGAIAETNIWIIGPVRGLYATSKDGNLPPFFQRVNKRGMPTRLLVFQAIIVSISACIIPCMPTASASFWLMSVLTAQLYLTMYILMFISAIRLRYTQPEIIRPYRIPYKHKGMWLVASIGIFSSVSAFLIGFVPPAQIRVGNLFLYEGFLIVGLIIMWLIPLGIYQCKKLYWNQCHISTKSPKKE